MIIEVSDVVPYIAMVIVSSITYYQGYNTGSKRSTDNEVYVKFIDEFNKQNHYIFTLRDECCKLSAELAKYKQGESGHERF